MSANSKIEWTDHTFNPWIGCTKVSPGCLHCYAEQRDIRLGGGSHWGKGASRQRTSAANWAQPRRWNEQASKLRLLDGEVYIYTGSTEIVGREDTRKFSVCLAGLPLKSRRSDDYRYVSPEEWNAAPKVRPRVFCASLADWLDDEVPREWLAHLLQLIQSTPNLDWLLLSKRPENWRNRLLQSQLYWQEEGGNAGISAFPWIERWLDGEAPANVWIGTTVEDQPRARRVFDLVDIPARVRFLSCEPMLWSVFLRRIEDAEGNTLDALTGSYCIDGRGRTAPTEHRVHWVICGGESGPGARPIHPDWARSLRDQCADAGVPFLFKQWGEWRPTMYGGDGSAEFQWAEHGQRWQWMCKVGKRLAGRQLDGVEHNGFPAQPPDATAGTL